MNKKISDTLISNSAKIYMHFLDRNLEHLTFFNLIFQSEKSQLHRIFSIMSDIYFQVLRYYMKKEYVDTYINQIHRIDPTDSTNFVPLEVIDIGIDIISKILFTLHF